ncbi:1-deoxy-D-xylulose-5-phosphate reductoisomerase, partial [Mycobacterium tuberculosis]|nr:1-deoxy-D-xylulose-5-phosphate reductoisomerase [Mycobacterium tuberculosis]
DWTQPRQFRFEPVDPRRFPAIGLARAALRAGGDAPNRLNAANEVAVAAFLEGRLPFQRITTVVEQVLAQTAAPFEAEDELSRILAVDAQ